MWQGYNRPDDESEQLGSAYSYNPYAQNDDLAPSPYAQQAPQSTQMPIGPNPYTPQPQIAQAAAQQTNGPDPNSVLRRYAKIMHDRRMLDQKSAPQPQGTQQAWSSWGSALSGRGGSGGSGGIPSIGGMFK